MIRNIILDRDGVINQDSAHYIKSPEEWIPIPGSLEAIAKLNHKGYRVFIATNQSGIARGYFSVETLSAIHAKLEAALAAHQGHVDGIFFCPHGPDDNCHCRKPRPGLLFDIANQMGIDLAESIMIGDSLRDIEAGLAARCQTVLVKTGKGEKTLAQGKKGLEQTEIFASLAQYVDTFRRLEGV